MPEKELEAVLQAVARFPESVSIVLVKTTGHVIIFKSVVGKLGKRDQQTVKFV